MTADDDDDQVMVVAYVPDLMDRSRLSAAARSAGVDVRFVRSGPDLAGSAVSADVVVVDLSRADSLDALAGLGGGARVIGFGSHVDTERLRAARAAGCDTVLARSAFFGDPARWLQRLDT
ncbi:MAG: hypothetical protein ACRD29_26580 [Acidimicrobiales bacterium]